MVYKEDRGSALREFAGWGKELRKNNSSYESMLLRLWHPVPSVQFSHSVVSDSLRPHGLQHARPPYPSPPPPRSLLKLMSIESVMPPNHLILCHPLLLPPSIFPSIKVFSNESALRISDQSIGVSASTSVLPMNIQD